VTRAGAIVLAGVAAALGASGTAVLLAGAVTRIGVQVRAALESSGRILDEVLAPLRKAGEEGRAATRAERRRLQAAIGAGSLPIALVLARPAPAVVLASAVALLAPRALVWRRERYTRRLGEGSATAATRIADALASGHTTRAAIALAGRDLAGPIGRELSLVAADLEFGATTDAALVAFRERASSRRIDLLVAAMRLQRRSGGNLAALLRDVAASLEDQARLEAEAEAETAQARFTSTVVLAMPFCMLALGELAAPGTVERLLGTPVGGWLLGSALALQIAGTVLVRRLARVDA
jgi:tight adherence protein B